MATVEKILGQSLPLANTPTVLYTSPALTTAKGKVFVCNQNDKEVKVYVALTASGNTLAAQDYLCFYRTVLPGETITIEEIQMGAEDFVTIKSSKTNVSFNFVGQETA